MLKATAENMKELPPEAKKVELDEKEKKIFKPDQIFRALHRIELVFGPKRTVAGPNKVTMFIWSNSASMNGNGDVLMRRCHSTNPKQPGGCGALVPVNNFSKNGDQALCSKCNKIIRTQYMSDKYEGKFSTAELAKKVTKVFLELNSNADIYLKYHLSDPHVLLMAKLLGESKAHELKGLAIYPALSLVKDTATGAAVDKRIESFLRS